jgi:hypothetical protein
VEEIEGRSKMEEGRGKMEEERYEHRHGAT